jgi:hypothetical protein
MRVEPFKAREMLAHIHLDECLPWTAESSEAVDHAAVLDAYFKVTGRASVSLSPHRRPP